jgi:hypothetical protein
MIMLNVIMLSVVMPSVVAPFNICEKGKRLALRVFASGEPFQPRLIFAVKTQVEQCLQGLYCKRYGFVIYKKWSDFQASYCFLLSVTYASLDKRTSLLRNPFITHP